MQLLGLFAFFLLLRSFLLHYSPVLEEKVALSSWYSTWSTLTFRKLSTDEMTLPSLAIDNNFISLLKCQIRIRFLGKNDLYGAFISPFVIWIVWGKPWKWNDVTHNTNSGKPLQFGESRSAIRPYNSPRHRKSIPLIICIITVEKYEQ